MRIRVLTVLSLLPFLAALPAEAATTIVDAWVGVQQAMGGNNAEILEAGLEELCFAADDVAVERLPPYAAALVYWARERPGDLGEVATLAAIRLDPDLPAARFLHARWNFENGSYGASLSAYLAGWLGMLRQPDVRRLMLASVGIWVLLSLGASLTVFVVLQTVSHLRILAHDARELGMVLFKWGNALAFAVVVLTLPLFAGLGPVWLLVYLFAMSWCYLAGTQRVVAVVACVGLALLVPGLEMLHLYTQQPVPITSRVSHLFEERMVDPSVLRQFTELEKEANDDPLYHLLLGEMLRMHGYPNGARIQFQTAASSDEKLADAFIFLGCLALERREINRAMEQFQLALGIREISPLAWANLSVAYDLDLQFEPADEARQKALELSGGDLASISVKSPKAQVRFPLLGRDEVTQLVANLSSEGRQHAGLRGLRLQPLGKLLAPWSLIFWVSALLGGLVLYVRTRWMWKAVACSRCGKVFCPRCASSGESQSTCAQCISVLEKRSGVSMDQQEAKLRQIRRWQELVLLTRRSIAIVLPGSGLILSRQGLGGLVLGFLSWLFLLGGLLWAPTCLPMLEPQASVLPIQVLFAVCFSLSWGVSVFSSWNRR